MYKFYSKCISFIENIKVLFKTSSNLENKKLNQEDVLEKFLKSFIQI